MKTLKWMKVDSSAIAGLAYERDKRVLHVLFHHGGLYSYSGIGYKRFYNLIHSDSVGKYFNQAIKPGPHTKENQK